MDVIVCACLLGKCLARLQRPGARPNAPRPALHFTDHTLQVTSQWYMAKSLLTYAYYLTHNSTPCIRRGAPLQAVCPLAAISAKSADCGASLILAALSITGADLSLVSVFFRLAPPFWMSANTAGALFSPTLTPASITCHDETYVSSHL